MDPSGISSTRQEKRTCSAWFWKGNEPTLPRVTDEGNASLELCHRNDLGLVSAGKTTKELAGYSRVLTLPPQTSSSSTQQPPLAMPEGAKDMLGPVQKISWELRLCRAAIPEQCPCRVSMLSSSHEKSEAYPGALTCLNSTGASPLPSVPKIPFLGSSQHWLCPCRKVPPGGCCTFFILFCLPKPTPAVGDPPRVCRAEPPRGEQPNSTSSPLEPRSCCWCARRAPSCRRLPG